MTTEDRIGKTVGIVAAGIIFMGLFVEFADSISKSGAGFSTFMWSSFVIAILMVLGYLVFYESTQDTKRGKRTANDEQTWTAYYVKTILENRGNLETSRARQEQMVELGKEEAAARWFDAVVECQENINSAIRDFRLEYPDSYEANKKTYGLPN